MNCTSHNVKVTEGNAFALILPLKSRHYVAEQPIDEDIDITLLQNVVVKVGGVTWEDVSLAVEGVTIGIPSTQARGTYNVELTAVYNEINIRAAYFECFTIVAWSYQSDVQNYIPDSPIIAEAAFFVAGNWTNEELEQLKQEYREKNAQLDQAIADAEEAKREWEEKAAELDDVAQESTLTQGVQDIREDISHIDIDTSDLAKQGTNPNATLSEVQRLVSDMGADQALIAQCYDILEAKGITMPQHKTLANLPDTIRLVRDIQGNIWFNVIGTTNFANVIDSKIWDFSNSFVIPTTIFNNVSNLVYAEEIYMPHFINGIQGFAYCFSNGLQALKLIDMTTVGDCSLNNNNTDAFRARNVETLIGKHTLEEVESGEITILNGMRISTSFSSMTKLNRASLLAIIKGVADMTGQTAPTLTFGADNIAKLTQEDLQIAYDKNWNIA